MAYIDLSRAFDSVHQDTLYKLLQRIGCPELFTDNIRDLLNGLQPEVLAEGMLSAPFSVLCGVRQGCPMVPLLFSIFFEYVLKDWRQRVAHIAKVELQTRVDGVLKRHFVRGEFYDQVVNFSALDLAVADDLLVLAETSEELAELVRHWYSTLVDWGLCMSDKTELLVLGGTGSVSAIDLTGVQGGFVLNEADDSKMGGALAGTGNLCYLGQTQSTHYGAKRELNVRTWKGWRAFYTYQASC